MFRALFKTKKIIIHPFRALPYNTTPYCKLLNEIFKEGQEVGNSPITSAIGRSEQEEYSSGPPWATQPRVSPPLHPDMRFFSLSQSISILELAPSSHSVLHRHFTKLYTVLYKKN